MNIKNIVKVMNFHALVRVDAAKRRAVKYMLLGDELYSMMDQIMNNRNLVLDKSVMRPGKDVPELTFYIGSDYGFCSNYNTLINSRISEEGGDKVIIGKKLRNPESDTLLRMHREEVEDRIPEIERLLYDAIAGKKHSAVYVVYHRYINSTTSSLERRQLYPFEIPAHTEAGFYKEDFQIEGNLTEILEGLLLTYVLYQIELACISGYASENIMRQNTTQESLEKIAEREEEQLMEERREHRSQEFKKVIENFSKKKGMGSGLR